MCIRDRPVPHALHPCHSHALPPTRHPNLHAPTRRLSRKHLRWQEGLHTHSHQRLFRNRVVTGEDRSKCHGCGSAPQLLPRGAAPAKLQSMLPAHANMSMTSTRRQNCTRRRRAAAAGSGVRSPQQHESHVHVARHAESLQRLARTPRHRTKRACTEHGVLLRGSGGVCAARHGGASKQERRQRGADVAAQQG